MAQHVKDPGENHADWIHESEQDRLIEMLTSELELARLQADTQMYKARSVVWLVAERYEKLQHDLEQQQQQNSPAKPDAEQMAKLGQRSSMLLGALCFTNLLALASLLILNWDELLSIFSN